MMLYMHTVYSERSRSLVTALKAPVRDFYRPKEVFCAAEIKLRTGTAWHFLHLHKEIGISLRWQDWPISADKFQIFGIC